MKIKNPSISGAYASESDMSGKNEVLKVTTIPFFRVAFLTVLLDRI